MFYNDYLRLGFKYEMLDGKRNQYAHCFPVYILVKKQSVINFPNSTHLTLIHVMLLTEIIVTKQFYNHPDIRLKF